MLLLIEDNRADIALLTEALHERPIPVQLCTVRTGKEALAFLHHEGPYRRAPRPDFIVLDLNLPQLTGHEVLAAVKRDKRLKAIPVVILTSSADPDDRARSYALGANVYVQKPLKFDSYLATLHDLIGFWCQRALLPSAV